ncbi:5-oxoprolinase subunit PxpB [Pseudidiomarina donghaiensis]|uniref:Allophanate hydrolase subunit 1 n=1 Tax=Pseudidiomarina donghaiensis TaxID=519452 RepID=A0A432XCR0_9GAMM|nr:5-oxoprolinase subunit PxpB [Pseudidiomarina donghaiensis]RUO46528.1 allophanate hydrolase subunit 1 [Pseudidiomarina donghaiensis]SFV24618.1 inhibitor of KinA [Pseudidiomarina donghaiensis]
MQARVEVAAIDAVMVAFEARVDLAINQAVHQFAAQLKQANPSWLRDIVPAYHSAMVVYDIHQTDLPSVTRYIEQLLRQPSEQHHSLASTQHRFKVCYEAPYAPDMPRVMEHTGLSAAQIIALHSAREYHVYTVGFAPGFAYLGDVDERIQTPRLATPRSKVPAGSVAIANQQTAIYPRTSPGGWNLIGRVANWNMNPNENLGWAIQAGDSVVFEVISAAEFAALEKQQRALS